MEKGGALGLGGDEQAENLDRLGRRGADLGDRELPGRRELGPGAPERGPRRQQALDRLGVVGFDGFLQLGFAHGPARRQDVQAQGERGEAQPPARGDCHGLSCPARPPSSRARNRR